MKHTIRVFCTNIEHRGINVLIIFIFNNCLPACILIGILNSIIL